MTTVSDPYRRTGRRTDGGGASRRPLLATQRRDEMGDYYWCMTHAQVEVGTVCRATDRLGPYASREDALAWRDRVDRRNDEWQAEDERWDGEDEEEEDDDW